MNTTQLENLKTNLVAFQDYLAELNINQNDGEDSEEVEEIQNTINLTRKYLTINSTPTIADVCELAHTLTIEKLGNKKAEKKIGKGIVYTTQGQKTFDHYYNLITNTLGL